MTVDSYPPTTIMGLVKELNKTVESINTVAVDTISSLERVTSRTYSPNEEQKDIKRNEYDTTIPTIDDILLNTLYALKDLKEYVVCINSNISFNILGNIIEPEGQTERSIPKRSNLKRRGVKLPTRGSPVASDDDDYED